MDDMRIFNYPTITIPILFQYETVYTFRRSHYAADGFQTEFRHRDAEAWLEHAPMPTSEEPHGRRPHAYQDREDLFVNERASLADLRGDLYSLDLDREQRPPVLWMYVGAPNFDYADEDAQTGAFRIVTDRERRIIGMAAHSPAQNGRFVRADERQEMYAVHIVQIIVPRPTTVMDSA